jgi:hypothetical protein
MLRRTLLLLMLAPVVSCASGGQSAGPSRNRDIITAEEVARTTFSTAYEVVESLRPEFMRSRSTSMGTGQSDNAVVYIDGVRAGGLNELRRVPREQIQEIRYLSGSDATTIYGTGHVGGAILVTTKR